ncbi:hypothetical protein [Rhizobium gallicum]|uniref:hypothetical protein n=1 Tax=Rhizobium gallicum TaxID=56730 RepID=UPI000A62CA5B|nr:hypothetical protein [Rhizobium gallicum]
MLNKVNGGISVKGMDFPVDHRFIGERTLDGPLFGNGTSGRLSNHYYVVARIFQRV